MIATHQHLIRTGELAKELGIHVSTLCQWTSGDNEAGSLWRSCLLRRGWYMVPKLRAAGLLSHPITVPHHEGACDVG